MICPFHHQSTAPAPAAPALGAPQLKAWDGRGRPPGGQATKNSLIIKKINFNHQHLFQKQFNHQNKCDLTI